MESAKKNPNFRPTTDPIISQRRYVILSYTSKYDKGKYPLGLNFLEYPNN